VKELEEQLYKRDTYFQPENRAAPDFALETIDGREVSLEDFRGKVVVLDFIYARCKDVCPLQSELLASIQKQINRTPMRDLVEFVSIATDTEDAQSTADIMRGYSAQHGFDPANWTFLYRGSGASDAGIKTGAAYGLKFEVTQDGDQVHGAVTHVIDQAGRLRARFHGLKFEPVDLILFVNALTNEPPGSANEASAEPALTSGTGPFAAVAGTVPPLWFDVLLAAVALGLTALAVVLIRMIRKSRA
jgi:protein SCO1/2